MQIFSDMQVDKIMENAEKAYKQNKLPESRKKEYLLTLRTYLTATGLIKNVCCYCLGTGKNITSRST